MPSNPDRFGYGWVPPAIPAAESPLARLGPETDSPNDYAGGSPKTEFVRLFPEEQPFRTAKEPVINAALESREPEQHDTPAIPPPDRAESPLSEPESAAILEPSREERVAGGAGTVAVGAAGAQRASTPEESTEAKMDDVVPDAVSPADSESPEEPRRRRAAGEVIEGLKKVTVALQAHGVDPGEALSDKPGQRAIVSELLDPDMTVEDIVLKTGLSRNYVYQAGGRALDSLIAEAEKQGIKNLPQPTGWQPNRRPEESVGSWLSAARRLKGVPVERLTQSLEFSAKSTVYNIFSGRTHGNRQLVEALGLEIGLDREVVDKLVEAHRAERAGDTDEARAILAGLSLPEYQVSTETPSRQQAASPASQPGAGDEFSLTETTVERRKRFGQDRETLRILTAHGVDVAELIRNSELTEPLQKHLVKALPLLLSGDSNAQIAQALDVEDTRIPRWTNRLLNAIKDNIPEELHPYLQPAGKPKSTEHSEAPTLGGVLQRKLNDANLTHDQAASRIGKSSDTLGRLLRDETPQAHSGSALLPLLEVLLDEGVLSDDEAAEYVDRYETRRRIAIAKRYYEHPSE